MPVTNDRFNALRESLAWARQFSPFHRVRLGDVDLDVGDERALISQVPILDRETVQAQPRWPISPLACVPADACVRVHHTSGSSGRGSLWVADTAEDWEHIVGAWRVALDQFGVRAADRALVCAAYGRFIGFWGLHDALVANESLVVSGADLDTVGRADLIARLRITVVAATPTYATVLGRALRERHCEHDVRLLITSGEPVPPATRRQLRSLWGCDTRDTAGMTEVGTISMVECTEARGVLHHLGAVTYEEVLDPETREPVQPGEVGVRVVTTLRRRAMPFIRYWTGDLVRLGAPRCGCGHAGHTYEGGIRGRTDDMTKVHGVWFLPSMVEDVMRSFPEVDEYRVVRLQDDAGVRDVRIEVEPHEDASADLLPVLRVVCKRELGFTPKVALSERGSLPRFEAKAARMVTVAADAEPRPC